MMKISELKATKAALATQVEESKLVLGDLRYKWGDSEVEYIAFCEEKAILIGQIARLHEDIARIRTSVCLQHLRDCYYRMQFILIGNWNANWPRARFFTSMKSSSMRTVSFLNPFKALLVGLVYLRKIWGILSLK